MGKVSFTRINTEEATGLWTVKTDRGKYIFDFDDNTFIMDSALSLGGFPAKQVWQHFSRAVVDTGSPLIIYFSGYKEKTSIVSGTVQQIVPIG